MQEVESDKTAYLTETECYQWVNKYGTTPFNQLALATAADNEAGPMTVMRSLFKIINDKNKAIKDKNAEIIRLKYGGKSIG